MRPASKGPSPAPKAAAASWHWDSPLPYLFAGLGLMLLLITGALVVLACSYIKRQSRTADYGGEKAEPAPAVISGGDLTPKIVVVMAGKDNPTHLAVPIKA